MSEEMFFCEMCAKWVWNNRQHICYNAAAKEELQKRIDAANKLVNKPIIDPVYPKDEECAPKCAEECDQCLAGFPCPVWKKPGSKRTDIYADECGEEWTLGEAVLSYANEIDEAHGDGSPFDALFYIYDESDISEKEMPFWTEVLKGMLSEAKYFRYRKELS